MRCILLLTAAVLSLLASAPRVDAAGGDFTVEFWLKGELSDSPAPAVEGGTGEGWLGGNVVFERDASKGGANDWGLSLGAGRVAFGITTGSLASFTLCGDTTVLDGEWHHVAVARRGDDGFLWLWIDGELDAAADGPDGAVSCAEPAGPRDADREPSPYAGLVHGVRVSSRLRYDAPFSRPAVPASPPEDVRGLPHGAVFEAYPNPALGQTILFARFPDGRTGRAAVTIHDGSGGKRASVAGTVDAGSILVIWDGRADDGTVLPAGRYSAELLAGSTTLSTEFVVP